MWSDGNFVGLSAVRGLEEKWRLWRGDAGGDESEAVSREGLDVMQGFAYDIHDFKAAERAVLAETGRLKEYRALRMLLTGTAGTGKSRTLRSICGMRRARARALLLYISKC